MNLNQLREQLSRTRYTVLIALVMLVMIYIGYQLAQLNFDYLQRQLDMMQTTTDNLAAENQQFITQANELRARVEIAEFANEALDERIKQGLERERTLTEQVTFYQKVVAPELSEDGFSIDGVQVAKTASENYFQLSMVLIQQTRVKSTINGVLNIQIHGSQNDRPTQLSLADIAMIEDDELRYSFKYFQTKELLFALPEGFIPERLVINTDIRQYRRSRGNYSRTLEWAEIQSWDESERS